MRVPWNFDLLFTAKCHPNSVLPLPHLPPLPTRCIEYGFTFADQVAAQLKAAPKSA